jgi:hypothetical protein
MKLADVPLPFLRCRDLRHAWDESTLVTAPHPDGIVERAVWCRRCDTRRTEIIEMPDGTVIARRYRYPQGYQTDRPVKQRTVRIFLIRKALRELKEKR